MPNRPGVAALALAALCAAGACRAAAPAAVETPQSIRAAIADALRSRLAGIKDATAEIGAVDSRLRLPACPAIEIELPAANAASMTAKVDCQEPSWTIYVPVRVHAWIEAVVASTNLAPNTKLTSDALAQGRVDAFSSAGGVLTAPARAEGRILRVGVMAGSPILASFLDTPLVVHRGQQVLLTLRDGDMTIRDSVVALEDGRIGDSIEVRSPQSQKIVHATVGSDGTVEMRF